MPPRISARIAALVLGASCVLACGDEPVPPESPATASTGPAPVTAGPASGSATGAPDDSTTGGPGSTTGPAPDTDPGDTTEGSGIKLDVGSGQEGNDVTLTGQVFAPNGEIPIAGAQVTLTAQLPAGIPDGVYCHECQPPAPGEFSALTDPDGTFELLADSQAFAPGSPAYLVVRKGQFLRVEPFAVQEGDHAVAPALTQLPGTHDPAAGRWIPRIAVYDTFPDEVFNVLAKFGLGQVSAAGTLVAGTEQFTLLPNDQGAIMDDPGQLSQYHIIFLPCASTKYWPQAPLVTPQRIQNIRDYVAAGGRWYATDHSNEYVKEPFPAYLDLHSPGMPDIQPAYTVSGTVVDAGLLAWLQALPPDLADIGGGNPTLGMLPLVELRHNYSGIDAVHEVLVQDDQGQDVNVGPHTWVTGPCTSCSDPIVERPMAITGQYGCGRMMYSTFETSSEPHQGLNPQELLLLYMILEIGVCQDDLMPPPQG